MWSYYTYSHTLKGIYCTVVQPLSAALPLNHSSFGAYVWWSVFITKLNCVVLGLKKRLIYLTVAWEVSVLPPRVTEWITETSPAVRYLQIFFFCFHYYFHTVGLLWALLQITVGGKCNKSHVLILSVWFHQASYTPRKKNYEVLLIVSATDNSTDKLKFVWLAETLLLGYISSKWFAWNQQSCLDKNCNIWLLCEWNGK